MSATTLLRRRPLHRWNVTPQRAALIQKSLAPLVVRSGTVRRLRLVAGADVAYLPRRGECLAGVVVWDVVRAEVVCEHVGRRAVRFPYVPGLLSFREGAALMNVLQRVREPVDAYLLDGHGYAHPRRFGLACHIGVLLDRPCVGCAKSVLVGSHESPGKFRGQTAPLMEGGECVGMALRTRERTKPVLVSVGHRVSLREAVRITLSCCTRYRLPEPTRLADQLVARAKRS